MASELAELGLKINGDQIVDAFEALDEFSASAKKAEEATQGLNRASEDATRASRARTDLTARESMLLRERQAVERQITDDVRLATEHMAAGKIAAEDYAVGISTAQQMAEELGLTTSTELVQSISQAEIAIAAAAADGRDLAEVLREMGVAGEGAADGIKKPVEDLGGAGERGAVGVGRLNNAMTSLLRQATGTHPVVAQLANVIGSLALGAATMTGVLAGLAALSLMWRRITQDARDARDAQRAALADLERLLEAQDQSRVAQLRAAIAPQQSRMAEIEAIIAAERAALGVSGVVGIDSPRITALQREYDELLRIVERGEAEITNARLVEMGRRQAESARARKADAEGVGALTDELDEASEEAAKLAQRMRDIKSVVQEMQNLDPIITKIGGETHQTRDPGSILADGYVVASKGLREWEADNKQAMEQAAEDAARAAEETKQSWIAALNGVGAAIGGIGQDIAAIAGSLVAGGPLGALGAGLTFATAFGGRNRDAEWLDAQARQAEEANRAADALNRLARATDESFEVRRLRAQGRDEEADVASLIAAQRGELDRLAQAFTDVFGTDPLGYLAGHPEFSGQSVTDMLANAGLDDLPPAIRTFLETILVHEQELAALKARQVELEAERVAQQERERQAFGLDLTARGAALGGDDRGAFVARLTGEANRELASAQALLEAGTITEQMFAELARVIGEEGTKAIRDYDAAIRAATEAAQLAAAAEEHRAAQDLRNLDVQILQLQGRETEAQDLRQFIELQDAIHQARSQEYLAKLNELHLIQDQTLAARLAQRASQDFTSSLQTQRREFEQSTRVLNAPAGFNLPGARAAAATTVVVNFAAGSVVQRSNESPEQFGNRIAQMIAERQQSGAPSLFG